MTKQIDKKWDFFKQHSVKLKIASENHVELQEWKKDLTVRATKAAEGNNLREKFEVFMEMMTAMVATQALDATLKTRSLATVMKNRHNIKDEELDKWLNGTSSTPSGCCLPTSPINSTNSQT
jgi:hypothetical protein